MSTTDGKRVTNTNKDLFMNDTDVHIKIKRVIKRWREEPSERNGWNIIDWEYVEFEEYMNNYGNIRKPKNLNIIRPEKSNDPILDKKLTGDSKQGDLRAMGITLNVMLYYATRKSYDEKERGNYDKDNYIFIMPTTYDRKQDINKPNYDKYLKVGNATYVTKFIMNLKRPETYDIYSLAHYKGKPQLDANNITVTLIYLGGEAGCVGFERTKYLNMHEIGYINKGLFELSDEELIRARESYAVNRISGNKKNHSIANLCLSKNGDITSNTKKEEIYVYYYYNMTTNEYSKKFNSFGELTDDILIRDIFLGYYTPMELDNLLFRAMQTGEAIDGYIKVFKEQDMIKTEKMIEKRKPRNKIFFTRRVGIGYSRDLKDRYDENTVGSLSEEVIANEVNKYRVENGVKAIKVSSISKYIRDIIGTANMPTDYAVLVEVGTDKNGKVKRKRKVICIIWAVPLSECSEEMLLKYTDDEFKKNNIIRLWN